MLKVFSLFSMAAACLASPAPQQMECQECVQEMHRLNTIIKATFSHLPRNIHSSEKYQSRRKKSQTDLKYVNAFQGSGHEIAGYLTDNYCPTLPEDSEACQHDLPRHYVEMLTAVVDHYFVEGALHICEAWGVCHARAGE